MAQICAAWQLMGPEMYTSMSALQAASAIIDRGCALHKMIRLITMVRLL